MLATDSTFPEGMLKPKTEYAVKTLNGSCPVASRTSATARTDELEGISENELRQPGLANNEILSSGRPVAPTSETLPRASGLAVSPVTELLITSRSIRSVAPLNCQIIAA